MRDLYSYVRSLVKPGSRTLPLNIFAGGDHVIVEARGAMTTRAGKLMTTSTASFTGFQGAGLWRCASTATRCFARRGWVCFRRARGQSRSPLNTNTCRQQSARPIWSNAFCIELTDKSRVSSRASSRYRFALGKNLRQTGSACSPKVCLHARKYGLNSHKEARHSGLKRISGSSYHKANPEDQKYEAFPRISFAEFQALRGTASTVPYACQK